jgi:iron complex outermembrane receptor protein
MRFSFFLFLILGFSSFGEIVKLERIYLGPETDYIKGLSLGSIEVIEVGEIKEEFLTVNESIENGIGVDLKTRGKFGIQEDLYIRGMGFEQNVIAVDGIVLNDPQTGHFNLDLPLTTYDLQEITIFRGASSSFYGSNAMGGAINFRTKSPVRDSLKMRTLVGNNQYRSFLLSLDKIFKPLTLHLSYEVNKSASSRPETDFEVQTLFTKCNFNEIWGTPSVILALNKKDFGADSFYSSNYPREEEHTKTRLFILDFDFEGEKFRICPKFY